MKVEIVEDGIKRLPDYSALTSKMTEIITASKV